MDSVIKEGKWQIIENANAMTKHMKRAEKDILEESKENKQSHKESW